MNWYVDMPTYCILQVHSIRTLTHILIPSEDSEPMGLKVDISLCWSTPWCVQWRLWVCHRWPVNAEWCWCWPTQLSHFHLPPLLIHTMMRSVKTLGVPQVASERRMMLVSMEVRWRLNARTKEISRSTASSSNWAEGGFSIRWRMCRKNSSVSWSGHKQ